MEVLRKVVRLQLRYYFSTRGRTDATDSGLPLQKFLVPESGERSAFLDSTRHSDWASMCTEPRDFDLPQNLICS